MLPYATNSDLVSDPLSSESLTVGIKTWAM